mgnify:FL=1|jgi:hypothetical protein
MICIEELGYEIKRLEVLFNNTDNPEEKLATQMVLNNLNNLVAQLSQLITTPDFKEMAKEYEPKEN